MAQVIYLWSVLLIFGIRSIGACEQENHSSITGILKDISPVDFVVQNEKGVFKFLKENNFEIKSPVGVKFGETVTVEYYRVAVKVVIDKNKESTKPQAEHPFENRIQDDRIFYEAKCLSTFPIYEATNEKPSGIFVAKAAH